jgi:hypothetical protein
MAVTHKSRYILAMNAKLKSLLGRVEDWPEQAQEEALQLLLTVEHEYAQPYELTADDKAAIDRSLENMRLGEFASDAEVSAAFRRRHGSP